MGYDEQAMDEGRKVWRTALKGACGGMLGGVLFMCIYYLVEQWTRPNPYNLLTLLATPVLVILGGMVGLLVAAWYSSD